MSQYPFAFSSSQQHAWIGQTGVSWTFCGASWQSLGEEEMRPLMLVRVQHFIYIIWTDPGHAACHVDRLQAQGIRYFCDGDIHTFCCLTVRSKNFHFSWDLLAQLCTHTPTCMHTFSRAAPSTRVRALWHVMQKHQPTQKVRRSVAKGSSSNMSLI